MEAYLVPDGQKSVYNSKNQDIDTEYCVFDIETTGLSFRTAKITEIGAMKIKNGKVIDTFECFVNPEEAIPYEVMKVTHITDDMVKEAETIEQVLTKFLEFVGNSILVAHNANFDIGFIRHFAKKHRLKFDNTYIDTLSIARDMFPEFKKFKLGVIAENLGIRGDVANRALDDVKTLVKVFELMINNLKEKGATNINDFENVFRDKLNLKHLPTYHATILVKNYEGLKNLYKLVSMSNLDYFYKKPKIPKSLFRKYSEGLILGSSCEEGELYRAIIDGYSETEIKQIATFYDYLEIQPTSNNMYMIRDGKVKDVEELQDINIKIAKLGEKLKKLVVATSDTHFLNKQDEVYRRILMAEQYYENADEQPPLYFRTTEEMLKEFEYLRQDKAYEVVVTNTNKIADMCEKIKPISDEKCYPHIENSEIEIKELAYDGAYRIYGNPLPIEVQERLDKELKSIIENDFATLYMIAQKLVQKSNADGYIVGNRGAAGSSLVAYCIGITEVDPIKYKIPFETFASFDGDKEPDFDLNFAGEYQTKAQEYVKEILDGGTTVKAGTIGTIAYNTAYEYAKKYYEDKDIGLSNMEIETLAQGITGIKRATGEHLGRVIIIPKNREIYDFTPIGHPEDEPNSNVITTHFDYHSIDMNLLKLDILAHDTPTMLHKLKELTGIDPTTIDLYDKETIEMMCTANTLGIPEFGTKFIRNMILETKPTTFDELIKISALSHGTDVWTDNAQELIKSGVATLKEVIACRDDVMNCLVEVGIEPKIAFEIMETVRKGRPSCNREPHWEEYKKVMKEHNVPEWYIKSCEKIKYMFPKAHSTSYTINAFRIAYYKVHYPEAFYRAYFEINDDIEDISTISTKEKVIEEIRELEKNKNDYKLLNQIEIYELVLEMFDKNISI